MNRLQSVPAVCEVECSAVAGEPPIRLLLPSSPQPAPPQLEELTLENNRLTAVLLNFACLRRLQVLHLYNNPLEASDGSFQDSSLLCRGD